MNHSRRRAFHTIFSDSVGAAGRWLLAVSILAAAPVTAANIDLNTRADTELRASPTSIGVFDADGAAIIVGDAKGLQLLRSEAAGFRVIAAQATSSPVDAVAATVVASGRFVAYTQRGEQAVHVVPATARGTIGTGPAVPVPGRPRAIVPVPQQGFVVVHSGGVDLLEPAAAGTFRRRHLSSVTGAVDAAVIDLDGDDRLDLVVVDEPLGELVVLQGGHGDEMLQVATLRTQRGPTRLVAVNIDGDPEQEIVVLGYLGLSVHDRANDGSLKAEQPQLESSHLADLASGDIDGDGIGDVIFTNRSRTIVSSLLGTAGGKLEDGPAFLTGAGPGPLVVTPLTSDARQGIVVANQLGNSLTHVRHDRRGLVGVAGVVASIGPVSAAAAADFNGDGHLDLALAGDDTGRIEVHLGMGNGHFRVTPSYPIGMTPRAMVTGDWDGDRLFDLAIADFGADRVAILQGNGKGGFAAPTLIPVGTGPSALLHGDFGGPAGNDLAVANRLADSVTILFGDRAGHFRAGPVFEVGPRPSFLFWGDFDGDGDADIVAGNPQYETITVLPRSASGFDDSYNKVLADTPNPSAAHDLDGDGIPELIVTNAAAGAITVLQGDKGQFTPLESISVGRAPSAIEFGDFDADGRQDLAVLHKSTGIVAILLRHED